MCPALGSTPTAPGSAGCGTHLFRSDCLVQCGGVFPRPLVDIITPRYGQQTDELHSSIN